MDVLLLCHGVQDPGTRLTVKDGQTLKYRWNFGTALDVFNGARLAQLLFDIPDVTDDQIRSEIAEYNPPAAVVGPATGTPNIHLGGGTLPPCYAVNITMRTWAPLDGSWRTDLNSVLAELAGGAVTLNLLSCSELPKIDIMGPHLGKFVQHENWQAVAHGTAPSVAAR